MNSSFRRLLVLVAVFATAFAVVFLMRNGISGVKDLMGSKLAKQSNRSETFTLPIESALELGDVELLARLNEEYAKITDAVVDSVVSIDTSGISARRLLDGFGRPTVQSIPTQGQGSGVFVSREGHIVTNYHVIRDQQQIQITFADGRRRLASLIGVDPQLDIAVLKAEGDGPFEPLKFGDSAEVRRGQIVFAVGNPFGLGETVTQGIISAVDRSVSDTQRDLFQTDAAINPGSSGGPLVNLRGEIIGINSAIYRPDERVKSGFQGVGFSIPANDVKSALLAIFERGRPIRGYLGVHMDPDPRIKERLGYEGPGFAVIQVAPDSPAEGAGLKPYDIILSYGGTEIQSLNQLFSLVQNSEIGSLSQIKIWRLGRTLEVNAKITEASPTVGPSPATQLGDPDPRVVLQAIGIMVVTPTLETTDAVADRKGVLVAKVFPDSLSSDKVSANDQIISVNEQPVKSANDFYLRVATSALSQTTTLDLLRGDRMLKVELDRLPLDLQAESSAPNQK